MLQLLKQDILNNLKNIPGWHTRRKIVIIECDDWGSIRMPSKVVFDNLIRSGLKVPSGWFNLCDTLETGKDLERLFDTLNSVKDKENKSAVMTPVTIVANPDFDKIRSCGFSEYHYEPFTETLKRYYPGDDVFKLWKEGMTAGIFMPELHGREHITVQIWMQKLKEGNKDLLIAFDNGYTSMDIPGIPAPAKEFGTEFYFTSEDQKPFLIKSVKDGVSLFTQIFGYLPHVFVPSNGVFHPEFDRVVAENGIRFLNVNNSTAYPVNGDELKFRHFITGQKGPGGITYYTRNCAFEPGDSRYKGIESTLRQIASAFRWGKPASISTHRANYAGGLEPTNRENGLSELKKLLNAIVKKWPDVEFMSSCNGLEHMKSMN
jgi:hypothetical protein